MTHIRCIHIVSQAHVLVIVPLAVRSLHLEDLEEDKAFGWCEERIGLLISVAVGCVFLVHDASALTFAQISYFVWDTLDAIINFTDIGFVLHGISAPS